MPKDLKSRTDIDREKSEMDRILSEEEEKQDQHQADAKATEKALSSIDSAGTREGHDQRIRASQSIDQSVKREADKLQQAERKLSDQGKQVEGELDQTARQAEKDQKTLESALQEVRFEPARKELGSAAEASSGDAAFTDSTRKEREGRRDKADQKTTRFHGEIKGMRFRPGKG